MKNEIPKILQGIISSEELQKGIGLKTVECPFKKKDCGSLCIECEKAKDIHRAFIAMCSEGLIRSSKLPADGSVQTTISGFGSLETRNGKVFCAINPLKNLI